MQNPAAEDEAPLPGLWQRAVPPRTMLALGVLLALLASLPVVLASSPQMSDYPAHLARYHVMLEIGRSPWLARYYDFSWIWTGNLGVDLLIRPLAPLIGLEAAGRLIVGVIPALTGLAILAVDWTLRRRIGIGAILAFATIWSPALSIGFINFGLSLALALGAFALWVRLEGWRGRGWLFVPVSWIVWLCHLSGWGVLGVLVFGYEWSRRRSIAAFLLPLPLALPLLAMLGTAQSEATAGAGLALYGENPLAFKVAIWLHALRAQAMMLDVLSVLALIGCVAIAVRTRRFDSRLGWAAGLLVLLSLVMPRHLGGGDEADFRLTAVSLMIAALAIDWKAPRWAVWLAAALFLLRIGVTSAAWERDAREMDVVLRALDHVPQGARVASAVAVDRRAWRLNPFEHIGGYATVRRDALVNSHFAIPGVHMLQLRQAMAGTDFTDPSQRVLLEPGEPIDLAAFVPARHADYLWYVGPRQPDHLPAGARILYRTQHSLLARLANPPSRR